jgi:hypothetical protein
MGQGDPLRRDQGGVIFPRRIRRRPSSRANWRSGVRLLSLLAAIFFSVMIVPVAAQSSLPPNAPLKIRLQFNIRPQEFDELRNLLTQFAQNEHLTVIDQGAGMFPRGGRVPFYLQLNSTDGSTEIAVTNIRAEDLMFVWFYEYGAGSNLAVLDSKLEPILREKWPTLAPYRGS